MAVALLAPACADRADIDETGAGREPASTGDGATRADADETGALDTSGCQLHDQIEYCHEAFTPAGIEQPAPLVIDLHGFGGSAERQRAGSGFAQLAIDEGFTVVWPNGHQASWNGGRFCCGAAAALELDDVGYLRALVETIAADHPIDRDRIYVTGLSNGCAMAQRLAADASDLVAAVGCMALYLLDEPDAGYEPVPVMEIHGTEDLLVPYDGSVVMTGAEANVAAWADRNGCTGTPVTEEASGYVVTRYEACTGAEAALVTVPGGGHALYRGMETDVDTSRLAWQFMSRFRR